MLKVDKLINNIPSFNPCSANVDCRVSS